MKPRKDQKPHLDAALTPDQAQQLKSWLRGGMTYRAAVPILKEKFGIVTNTRQLCLFWQRKCERRPVAPSRHGRPVLLDFRVYRRGDGWQFLLLQRSPGLRIFIDKRQVKALAKVTRAAK